jgi:AcrR family transcriptional regulator
VLPREPFIFNFPSWDDLLVSVRGHLISTYAAEARARLAADYAIPWTVIENECVPFVDYVVALGELHESVFHGPSANQTAGKERAADALIAEMLTMCIAAGSCRSVTAEMAAPLLFSVLHATADGIARTGHREARIEVLLQLLRSWLRA